MHYIIQENIFKENHYNLLIETMDKLKLSYDIVRIFPYVDKITLLSDIPPDFDIVEDLPDYIPPAGKIFCFGAIKLTRTAAKKNWKPGSMMNENHDYRVYSQYYKENLLNYDSEIVTFSAQLSWLDDELKFIRPAQDTKSFTGKVYSKEDWEELVERQLKNTTFLLNKDTSIQVSTPKNIQKEIRFWVINGKIITGSQYRLGNDTIYHTYFDEEAQIFAQKMVDLYQIAECFVIDVCLTDDVWKVVECNCINAAGFYLCNIQKMIMELEYFYNPENFE